MRVDLDVLELMPSEVAGIEYCDLCSDWFDIGHAHLLTDYPLRPKPVQQPEEIASLPTAKSSVKTIHTYLIGSTADGFIKIGKSFDPESRLKALQTASPHKLALVKVIRGDIEAELHRRFSKLRAIGEWFRCKGELLDFLGQP